MLQKPLIKIKPIVSILLVTILIFTIALLIGRVLIPFIIALIIAYILNPLVDKLEEEFTIKRKYSALFFSLTTLILFISVPAFVLPVLADEATVVIEKLPQIISLINTHVMSIFNEQFGTHISVDLNTLKEVLLSNQEKITNNLDIVRRIAQNSFILIEILVYMILIPFSLFYSILNWHKIIRIFDELVPRSFTDAAHSLAHDIDEMLSSYLRGQLSVMMIMAAYYAIGLTIIGLPSGAAIGIVTGLLVFIPYLGVISGFLFAIVSSVAQVGGTEGIMQIIIVFAIGHMLEGGIVTPFLVGGRIGLNPIMIILSLMIFGKVFGIVGILLALPLSTIAVVLVRHAKRYYKSTSYYLD
ncbi:MAG: AI-2E family transporter [Burkholderiales bacterium]|nr:AI-2E family transporter [Burkholderiales bacterium]